MAISIVDLSLVISIKYENLPTWAIPREFGFTGPNISGVETVFRLPGIYQNGVFLFKVDTPELEMAFLDRTETHMRFSVSE